MNVHTLITDLFITFEIAGQCTCQLCPKVIIVEFNLFIVVFFLDIQPYNKVFLQNFKLMIYILYTSNYVLIINLLGYEIQKSYIQMITKLARITITCICINKDIKK